MIVDILPVFIFVALGYGFKHIKHDISEHLVEFVIYFSLPAVALKMRFLEFDEALINIIVIAYIAMGIAALISYLVGKKLGLNRNMLATFMVACIFGNTSFVAFAYIESLYSMDELVYPLVYDMLGSFVALLTVGMVLIAWGVQKEDKTTLKQKIKMFFTPPLIAIIFAIVFHGVHFGEAVEGVITKLQYTLIPLVTMIVGMKLEVKALTRYLKETSIVVGIKMLLVPSIVFFGMSFFFSFDENWMKIALLEVAMPSQTMATVLAIRGGLNKDLAINTLGLGILASFIIIPFWNFIVNL